MQMPGRIWPADSTDRYTFGFQGMLRDDDWHGKGNHYNTLFRQYDPRLGRWLSPDPIQHSRQSSYAAFNNNPVYFVDPLGSQAHGNNEESDPPKGTQEWSQ